MSRPLRFCMVTTFYPPYHFGGDAIFVQRLANALANRGHHVEVIHCQDAYRLLAGKTLTENDDHHPNVTVHRLKSPAGFLSPLSTQQIGRPWFKAGPIRRVLDAGFDVIHFHNISLVGGPGILSYGQGVKLYTLHEYWLGCETHVRFKFNRDACPQPKGLDCAMCSVVHRRPPQLWRYSGLVNTGVKHVDAFIAPSRFSQAWHQQMAFDTPIVHLPHFVPEIPASSGGEVAGSNAEAPYFLFVGRLEKLKGLQTLIPVFRRYPYAQLWIAGSGRFEPELRRLADCHDRIRFLGHQSGAQLRALYRHAVAVLVPSVWQEVFGLVILEAFQHRTPAIVRNRGGMPELIDESQGGFVYDTDAELVTALDRLLHEPGLRRRLGQQAYRAYRRTWTTDVHVQRYLNLVSEIQQKKAS